ncbi:MAG TPA: VWA domain-containing protein [Rhodothermales bacterium]|nr:VWA domain-containing protein [Rhodothermales bacterium]
MSEPEDVLLDGAHHAALFAQRLWRRHLGSTQPETVRLVDCRSRLELFVRAAFAIPLTIGVAEPPALPSLLSRLVRRLPRHLVERRALASADDTCIRLPRTLPKLTQSARELTMYHLLATELAARVERETLRYLPEDTLERDLYLVREAACTDRRIAETLPGLLPALGKARVEARAERPALKLLTPREAAVEAEVLSVLASNPLDCDDGSPEESLRWAEEKAAAICTLEGTYRGLPAVALWGRLTPRPAVAKRTVVSAVDSDVDAPRPRISRLNRRPKVRRALDDEDDENAGIWMVQLDDPHEHVEDPMGLQRPADRDDEVDPDDLADSLSELPEARLVAAPGRPREVLASDDSPPSSAAEVLRDSRRPALVYPEWDYRAGAYAHLGAVVRERTPALGDPNWAEEVLERRAALLHEVRRRFERLRPRRMRRGRQADGPEIDLAAYVAAYADRRAGYPADDRLYEAVHHARRDVAIALLVDVSGSTDSWVTDNLRVVDVEKEALLVVCDALDALGDPYTILAFSGEGPESVSILPVKRFKERHRGTVRRRIAALEPDRYTRMGAAIRHATAELLAKPARYRLLLVLSDGKPNDVDHYQGRYGVEDARQAAVEARLQSVHPFCVTVDRLAPAYMPRIFGAGGYAALHRPEHLPMVLVDVLRRLVRS